MGFIFESDSELWSYREYKMMKIYKGFALCLLVALNLLVATEAAEWCKAATENGKPEYGVCLPDGEGSAQYMVEILPVSGSAIDLHADVSLEIIGAAGVAT